MVGDEKKLNKISRAKRVPRDTAQVCLVGCASGHSALFPYKRAHARGTRIFTMSRNLLRADSPAENKYVTFLFSILEELLGGFGVEIGGAQPNQDRVKTESRVFA